MDKVGAIILAGGTTHDRELRAISSQKSLMLLNGKPMVEWVMEALRGSPSIGRVAVVGPPSLLYASIREKSDFVLPEADHEVENLLTGIEALQESERMLMVTSDMPLLTPVAIDDFLSNAPSADVVYPIVSKDATLAYIPERRWIFIKATDGSFTGSNAVLFRPNVFKTHVEILRRIFDSRRSVIALVRLWGIAFSLKYVLHLLSIKEAEKRISDTLAVDAKAYISRYAELAFDVDHVCDVAIAERKLKQSS